MYTFGIMHERLKPSLRDVVRLQAGGKDTAERRSCIWLTYLRKYSTLYKSKEKDENVRANAGLYICIKNSILYPNLTSPHHATPHLTSPRHATPHLTSPRHATPRHATPRHATPRHVTPRHATPRHATPRHATPRHATPRHATPRHATPRHARPRHATPRQARPHQLLTKPRKRKDTDAKIGTWQVETQILIKISIFGDSRP